MKENFDEPEIVKMLNNDFIPVLCDTSAAPHLTLAAKAMAQIMLGHAGWPLFLFMTPQREPIFASSYMPKQSADSRVPGLLDVLRRIKWLWLMKRPQINEAAKSYAVQMKEALSPYTAPVQSNLASRASSQLMEEADASISMEDKEFIAQYAFRTGDTELVKKLIEELQEKDADKEAIQTKYMLILSISLYTFFSRMFELRYIL